MTGIFTRRFNWLPQASAWQQAQAWRAKRRAMADDFQSSVNALASGLGNAIAAQIDGQGTLIAKVVTTRLQAEINAKVTKATALSNSVNHVA